MDERRVGVIGATSLVGECLLPQLAAAGRRVVAFSRRPVETIDERVEWRRLMPSPTPTAGSGIERIENWIFLAPLWVLPEYFDFLHAHGVRRIVVLSSTSRFTKHDSSDRKEQAVAMALEEGEKRLQSWAERNRVDWVVLRPTMIYGRGRDKNISAVIRFIRRFGFFPLLGEARGRRQPVHAADVAQACAAALDAHAARNQSYNLGGGEILTYRDMVIRIFHALARKPKLLSLPLGMFRVAAAVLRWIPPCRHVTAAMAERMQRDLVFDHGEAARDLDFAPRSFQLAKEDLPA